MARTRNQGSKWIRPTKRLAIYLRDGCACAYCGDTLEDGATLTLDHITACELGGSNDESNLITCCLSCNSSKRALTMRQWYAILRDRGVDTSTISRTVRKLTHRDLTPYKAQAKQTIANR